MKTSDPSAMAWLERQVWCLSSSGQALQINCPGLGALIHLKQLLWGPGLQWVNEPPLELSLVQSDNLKGMIGLN